MDFNEIMDMWTEYDLELDSEEEECLITAMENYVLSAPHYVAYAVKKQYNGIGKMYLLRHLVPSIWIDYAGNSVWIDLACGTADTVYVCTRNLPDGIDGNIKVDEAVAMILVGIDSYERTR